jgi:hypothetical protein
MGARIVREQRIRCGEERGVEIVGVAGSLASGRQASPELAVFELIDGSFFNQFSAAEVTWFLVARCV